MSYAICTVLCGCKVDSEIIKFIENYGYEAEDIGCESQYSASGESLMICGVELFEFDECKDLLASKLLPKLTPSEAQIKKATKMLQSTRDKLESLIEDEDDEDEHKELGKKLISKIPTVPEVILVWSSS